ncbi:MAG: aspartate/tyrosine/aromatic aminotransferase [Pirellulaceae bacterium]|jgi:aspartate/tyrosine/aromatic aminotransferase|nr:aspartate/tyrosine/aromatic aminotransferase [Pirellulaceae bacterium]
MLETLQMAPPDPILGLSEAFRQDPNPHKINLSVGVYQDAQGKTPTLAVVKAAERRLLEEEANKGYLGIDGLPEYGRHVQELLLGPAHPIIAQGRAVTAQTPGGTGALRVAADFFQQKLRGRRIWVSEPTWANHPSVFQAAGLEVGTYPYLNAAGTGLDLDGLLATLRTVPAGDAVCLHASCHNPTGIDPTVDQWRLIAQVLVQRQLLPLVDFAYQGFAESIEADRAGLLVLADADVDMLICSSFSKNFGLYGERVGALTLVAPTAERAQVGLSHIKVCIRTNYSNPPRHGGLIVARILGDSQLRARWLDEVTAMRDRIAGMRRLFVDTLRAKGVTRDFSFITQQRGMFSYSGITPAQVDRLRSEYAIYLVRSGRINVAGMTESNMDRLCDAIRDVL